MESADVILRLMNEIEKLKKELQELKKSRVTTQPLVGDFDVYSLSEFFGVLSSPERLSIIKLLFERDRYFSELEKILNLGPSSLRHHLSRLIKFGIIAQERSRGKYIITDFGRRVFSFLVRTYKEFIEG